MTQPQQIPTFTRNHFRPIVTSYFPQPPPIAAHQAHPPPRVITPPEPGPMMTDIVVTSHQAVPPNGLKVQEATTASSDARRNREATILDTPTFGKTFFYYVCFIVCLCVLYIDADNVSECESVGSVGDGQHIKEKSLQQDSNLFDVLKILREAKRKKSKCTDEKYKRFSMNNFEELKNSMAEFPEQFPKTHEVNSNTQTDDSHLSKSRNYSVLSNFFKLKV